MNEGSIPTENINNPAIVYGTDSQHGPVAKFIVPDWGDKVDSGIGLSYLPATARLPIGWQAGTTALCRSQTFLPEYARQHFLGIIRLLIIFLGLDILDCSARDWERSGLLGGIPRVVVQISALF